MRHTDAMPFLISTILFALAVVLVVLTRMRLVKENAPVAGRLDTPTTLAVTVEYGRGVSRNQATRTGPTGLLRAVEARR
jgi:hypothetical protein